MLKNSVQMAKTAENRLDYTRNSKTPTHPTYPTVGFFQNGQIPKSPTDPKPE